MLNKVLYDGLCGAVGRGLLRGKTVQVKREGERAVFGSEEIDPVTGTAKRRLLDSGETYNVCCPFCRRSADFRYRLSFSHVWDVHDSLSSTRNTWAAHCYNEECQRHPDFYHKMQDILYPLFRPDRDDQPLSSIEAPTGYKPTKPDWPGPTVNIADLPPDHPAVLFLVNKGHDPIRLGHHFDVRYCTESRFRNARQRIILPFYGKDGSLDGWQARFVSEESSGDCRNLWDCADCWNTFYATRSVYNSAVSSIGGGVETARVCVNFGSVGNSHPIPKYSTMAGMRKSESLCFLSTASQWPLCVVVEGPMDVYGVGSPQGRDLPGPGLCGLGSQLSFEQTRALVLAFSGKPVVMMMDSSDPKAMRYQRDFVNRYQSVFCPLVGLELPGNADPDEIDHTELWSLIRDAISASGFICPI
jgi:hypothetical protein